MPLVKYTANGDPTDGTGAINLEAGKNGQQRVLVLGSDPLELTDQEYASLRGRYQLEEVQEAPQAASDEPSPSFSSSFGKLSTPAEGTS